MTVDCQYVELLTKILREGCSIKTRNSKVKRLDTQVMEFDSTPLIGVRKTAWRNSLREWEWFMSGSTNINDLHPAVQHWWKPWANGEGYIHNNYSAQFRSAYGVEEEYGYDMPKRNLIETDQIENLLAGVKRHPFSRRNILTTWNAAEMVHPSTPITNCHNSLTQLFGHPDGSLSLTMYQRSADTVCGLPSNLIQEWAFLMWLCHWSGRKVGKMKVILGDAHLYEVHFDLAKEIVDRAGEVAPTPNLVYNPSSEEFRADDFSLDGEYRPVISTKAEMVV